MQCKECMITVQAKESGENYLVLKILDNDQLLLINKDGRIIKDRYYSYIVVSPRVNPVGDTSKEKKQKKDITQFTRGTKKDELK